MNKLEILELEIDQRNKAKERAQLSREMADQLMPMFSNLAVALKATIDELTEALSDSGIKITKEVQLGGTVKTEDLNSAKLIKTLADLSRNLAAVTEVKGSVAIKNPVEVSNLNEIKIPDRVDVKLKTEATAKPKEFLPIRLTDGQRWISPEMLGSSGGATIINGGGSGGDSIITISNAYSDSDKDLGGTAKYRGYLSADGHWYIRRDLDGATRYRAGTSGYSTAWDARGDDSAWYLRSEVTILSPIGGGGTVDPGLPDGAMLTEDGSALTNEAGDYIIQA